MKTSKVILGNDPLKKAEIIDVFTQALSGDPAFIWLYQPHIYKSVKWISTFYYNICFPSNHVYVTEGKVLGGSMWVPPGKEISFSDLVKNGLLGAPFHLGPMGAYLTLMAFIKNESYKKKFAPEHHWFLADLGLIPEARGKGIGKLLLEPVLNKADDANEHCYCESSNPKNLSFYKRMGFEVIHTENVNKSASAPPVFYQLRKPR